MYTYIYVYIHICIHVKIYTYMYIYFFHLSTSFFHIQHLSACAGYGNYIIHTLEHFHLNILAYRVYNYTTNITLAELVLFDAELI